MSVHLSEAQLHKAVTQFLKVALPPDAVFHHSPNEGRRGWKAQRALKDTGTQAGWPDIEIIYGGHVLFIELKSARGKVSDKQNALALRLYDAGAYYAICRSLDDVQAILRFYLFPLRAHLTATGAIVSDAA